MKNKISSMLDSVADSLEKKGLLKEAEEIDTISNTLDATNWGSPPFSGRPWEKTPKDMMPTTLGPLTGKSVKDLEDMREDLFEEARELSAMMSGMSSADQHQKMEIKSRLEAIKDEERRIEDELRKKADI